MSELELQIEFEDLLKKEHEYGKYKNPSAKIILERNHNMIQMMWLLMKIKFLKKVK